MSDALAAWLNDQVDEDERRARSPGGNTVVIVYGGGSGAPGNAGGGGSSGSAENLDTSRALREVAFKRALLAAWQSAEASAPSDSWDSDGTQALESVARLLADFYSDRPGYAEAIA